MILKCKSVALLSEGTRAESAALVRRLELAGLDVQVFADASGLLREARDEDFQLFLLDQQAQDVELAFQGLKSWLDGTALIVFYNCDDNEFRLADALAQGADDYITAGRAREIVARSCALVRRSEGTAASRRGLLELPPYRFDMASKQAFVEGRRVVLTDKEFELTVFLFRNPGRLLSRDKLLEAVWGSRHMAASRTVDTHVSRIRRKLDIHPGRGFRLSASYGSGYRLERVDDSPEAGPSFPDPAYFKVSHPS